MKFCAGSQVQHETLEEGQRTHQPKPCEHNNEDENNSLNILCDKNIILFALVTFTKISMAVFLLSIQANFNVICHIKGTTQLYIKEVHRRLRFYKITRLTAYVYG